jgi:hypothetical protein
MMLHVSDLEHAQKCPALFFLSRKERHGHSSYYHLVEPFSTLWKKKLDLQDAPSTHVGATNEETLALLKENNVILNARFEKNGLRVRIPVLKRYAQNSYEAIYPFLSASPKENELYRMKINDLVAKEQGIHIYRHSILYINKDYEREGNLDAKMLLIQSKRLFKRRNTPTAPIDTLLKNYPLDLNAEMQRALDLLALPEEEVQPLRNKYCTANRKCAFYETCFDESGLEDDSVLFLTNAHFRTGKKDLGEQRIYELEPEEVDGFWLQYAQYQASKNHGQYIDKRAIAAWLSDIEYPISYLDFEWDTFAFPPYKKMHPLEVVCFQYSLHVEKADGTLSHDDFFGPNDCRKEFIESLIAHVPSQGTILVYNMEGAEKLRLIQLADTFPEYKEQLEQIWSRMKDLSKPFEYGLFYDNRQRGHYSLKSMLPIFTNEKSYHELNIQNGLDAVAEYRTYDEKNEQEQEILKQNMSDYCALDTYAEYVLYHGLKEMVKEFEV